MPTLEELHSIAQQQTNNAFCEAELTERDSSIVKLRGMVSDCELETLELKNALGAERVAKEFYKQDAADNMSLYDNLLTQYEKVVKKAGKSALWAWFTPIAAAIGFLVGASK